MATAARPPTRCPAILRDVAAAGLRTVTVSELAALAPERQTSWKRIALVVARRRG